MYRLKLCWEILRGRGVIYRARFVIVGKVTIYPMDDESSVHVVEIDIEGETEKPIVYQTENHMTFVAK